LSPSFLRRRRDSNRICLVVRADCTTDFCIRSHTGSLSDGVRRFVCPATARSKIRSPLSLVAGCPDCFHHCRRLLQSPPVVSTSAGADRFCLCWRRMCVCWIQNFFASGCNHIVNFAFGRVLDFWLRMCPTIL